MLGIITPLTVFVGNCAGKGNFGLVKSHIKTGNWIVGCSISVIATCMIMFRRELGHLFINDDEVVEVCANVLVLYGVGIIPDYIVNTVGSYLRTLGHEAFVMKHFLISYYLIGLTLSSVLCFVYGLGYEGVWIGIIFAIYLMAAFVSVKMLVSNMKKDVNRIYREMSLESDGEKEEFVEKDSKGLN